MRAWIKRLQQRTRPPRYHWWVIENDQVAGYGDHDVVLSMDPFRSMDEAKAFATKFGEFDPEWPRAIRVVRTLRGEKPRLRRLRLEPNSCGPVDLYFRGGGVPNARSLEILRLAQETHDRRR